MSFELTTYLILFLGGLCTISILWRNHIKNKCDNLITKANCVALDRQYNIDIISVLSILDTFIDKSFDDMIMLNINYARKTHVTGQEQKDINKEFYQLILNRISPAFLNKLTLIYDISSINNIIAERCYLKVLEWAQSLNEIKIDKDEDSISEDNNEMNLFDTENYS